VLHWTEQWGLCALRTLLGEIGIDREQAHFSEGSGLSRQDMVSPHATTTLLAWIARQPWATTLSDALPSAGTDGTLTWRLRNLPDGDSVQAKTGTLAHMYTLSGFLDASGGRRLAFSLMLNNYQRPIEPNGDWAPPYPTHDLDAIVRLIAVYADAPVKIPAPIERPR
jgi:D-alanyl-D-alanine carboxypeptidase/D-alanyl-D-alanine-endopeptidase (penicillin-binding protein 4)